jgi:hypothetical protein
MDQKILFLIQGNKSWMALRKIFVYFTFLLSKSSGLQRKHLPSQCCAGGGRGKRDSFQPEAVSLVMALKRLRFRVKGTAS